jgi:hypothetical protein
MSESRSDSNSEKRQLLLESYRLYMERLNSEISIHWTRVNILVVALSAALAGYGYVFIELSEARCDNGMMHFVVIAGQVVSFAIASVGQRILLKGKHYQDISEDRLIAIEQNLFSIRDRSTYNLGRCDDGTRCCRRSLYMCGKCGISSGSASITNTYSKLFDLIKSVLVISLICLFACSFGDRTSWFLVLTMGLVIAELVICLADDSIKVDIDCCSSDLCATDQLIRQSLRESFDCPYNNTIDTSPDKEPT